MPRNILKGPFLALLMALPVLALSLGGCPSATPSSPASATRTATSTSTLTPSRTSTPPATATSTATFTRTATPTRTATRTQTRTPTITLSPTPTANIVVNICRLWDDNHTISFQLNGGAAPSGVVTLKAGGVNYPMLCGSGPLTTNCYVQTPVAFAPGTAVTVEVSVPYKVGYMYGVQPGGLGFASNGSAVSWTHSGDRQNMIESCAMPTPGLCSGGTVWWTAPSSPATYAAVPVATAYPTPSVQYGLRAIIESRLTGVQVTPVFTHTIRESGYLIVP